MDLAFGDAKWQCTLGFRGISAFPLALTFIAPQDFVGYSAICCNNVTLRESIYSFSEDRTAAIRHRSG